MLTALTVNNKVSEKWYEKIINKIRGNTLSIDIKKARGVSLRHITYINRTGKIDWSKLNSVIGSQRNHLLCSENIQLPWELGFRRFDNAEFKSRLASNLGIYILSNLKNIKDIKVGFFDPKGQCTDVLPHLVQYTSNIVVVSDNLTAFNFEIRNIYEDMGATVQLTNNRIHLMDCNFVIAPLKIEELLPFSGNTIILSGARPTVCIAGFVYYDYYFRMPNKFDEIKPLELTEEYFSGALYSKAGQYQLGSIVPTVCKNYSSSQTYVSICDYLEKQKLR